MKSNLIKILLGVLVLSIVLSVSLLQLDALMDNACRGTDWCPEMEDACWLEGSEFTFYRRVGAICDGDYGDCVTLLKVECWYTDEMNFYTVYVNCYTPADPWECGG